MVCLLNLDLLILHELNAPVSVGNLGQVENMLGLFGFTQTHAVLMQAGDCTRNLLLRFGLVFASTNGLECSDFVACRCRAHSAYALIVRLRLGGNSSAKSTPACNTLLLLPRTRSRVRIAC